MNMFFTADILVMKESPTRLVQVNDSSSNCRSAELHHVSGIAFVLYLHLLRAKIVPDCIRPYCKTSMSPSTSLRIHQERGVTIMVTNHIQAIIDMKIVL